MFRLEQLLRKGWASQLRMSCHADGMAGHIDTLTSSWSPDNDSKVFGSFKKLHLLKCASSQPHGMTVEMRGQLAGAGPPAK